LFCSLALVTHKEDNVFLLIIQTSDNVVNFEQNYYCSVLSDFRNIRFHHLLICNLLKNINAFENIQKLETILSTKKLVSFNKETCMKRKK